MSFGLDTEGLDDFFYLGVSVIVAATSKPWDICCPVRKRFDRLVYVTLPDQQTRFAIIKHEFTNFQHNLTDEFFEYLASVTERCVLFDVGCHSRSVFF